MKHSKILSILWESKEKYGLINEELLAENTFMQQTSNGGDLWKAQLGITENFIIFLRCCSQLILNSNSNNKLLPEEISTLINMVPMHHLKIRRHRKRTIEITFPSGVVSYFKILMADGCGKAWSRWKALEQTCNTNISSAIPVAVLIPFLKLDRKTQKTIIADHFFMRICHTGVSQSSIRKRDSIKGIQDTNKKAKSRVTIDEEPEKGYLQPVDDTKSSKGKEETDTGKNLDVDTKSLRGTPTSKKNRKKRIIKTRQIRRFGEGVPENCMFDLTLSNCYSDAIEADNANEVYHNHDDEDDALFDLISLEERATRMISRSMSKSDSSETEKEGSSRIQSKEKINDKIYLEEQFLKMFSRSFTGLPIIEEEKPVKMESNESQPKMNNGKKRNDKMKTDKIFNTAHSFMNVCLVVIPSSLRTSKSVDSIRQIKDTKCDKIFVTRNLSLPYMNEMLFYRKHNRLNYSMEYFESRTQLLKSKNHYFHPISFWLPHKKSFGRIYCTMPICRKISAERVYSARQKALTMNLERKKLPKINVQNNPMYNEDKRGKTEQIRKQMKNSNKSANIFANPSKGCELEKELRAILEALLIHAEKEEKMPHPRETTKSDVKKKTSSEVDLALEPCRVAYELHQIQQRMFCEIENSELMRFILKPHTVTEMTCPYLCGFLFFFERLKNLVVAELSAQIEAREIARKYELYVKIALACFEGKDEQSAYAVMSGLCDPKIFYNKKLWTYILKNSEVENNLKHLFKMCYKGKKVPTTEKEIPFFLHFITFIMKNIIKVCKPSSGMDKGLIWNYLFGSFQNKESSTRCKNVSAEFTVLSYGNYERILEVIEESRKYFLFDVDFLESDAFTREYLLYKHFTV